MLPFLASYLQRYWGPFRLFNSHLVLLIVGACLSGLLTVFLLPRLWRFLPHDQGKALVKDSHLAQGKPTGAGLIIVSIITLTLILVIPPQLKLWGIFLCLFVSMLTGYLDDASATPWGQLKKGLLDFLVSAAAAALFAGGEAVEIWLPVFKGPLEGGAWSVSFWLFWPIATALLWICINVVNCSDGVDGLAGSVALLGLMTMGAFLYGIIGHQWTSKYLLIPHDPHGALWGAMVYTATGGLAGYLWYNAKPSKVLMGDAGSRFLGLLIGLTTLASHNFFLLLVAAPIFILDGGAGLVKLTLIRFYKRLGYDTRPPLRNFPQVQNPANFATDEEFARQPLPVRLLHSFRCPVHDHCRKNLGWSDTQVLVRFCLIQAFLMPLFILILIKLR